MRTVGLITEYNPFHNGHLYHLRESLKLAEADVSVAVMSGHFLQRGEPALVDKWLRTEMALAAGVDVVVELPLPWACSSAPDFAAGGVQALNSLGGVDALCFGSELGELAPLQHCAAVLCEQQEEIARKTARLLRDGISYPQARARLLAELLPNEFDAEQLAAPNNILAIEYLKALQSSASTIEPMTIRRIGAGYHETAVSKQGIASATGIRRRITAGEPVAELIPPQAFSPLQAALNAADYVSEDSYFALLLAHLLKSADELNRFWLVEAGIENRLHAVAQQASTLSELIEQSKSRQLTRTRIQRVLISILLGIQKEDAASLFVCGPQYLHLLGVSRKGEGFLAATRKQRQIPLVQNFSRVYQQLKRFYGVESVAHRQARRQLELESKSTRIYTLLTGNRPAGHRNRDFFAEVKT